MKKLFQAIVFSVLLVAVSAMVRHFQVEKHAVTMFRSMVHKIAPWINVEAVA